MMYVIEKRQLEENKGMIVLGNMWIDIEDENTSYGQVQLVAKTAKGWVSEKKIVIEKAKVIGNHPDDDDFLLLDPEQVEPLIAIFNRKNCKEWQSKNSGMDVNVAFALAGMKYGWVYDRIDELG